MSKTSVLKKEQEEHFKIEVGQTKRGTGPGWMRYGVFKTGLLHVHLGWCGLMVLIDSFRLHTNRLYFASLTHNSVCYNQMPGFIEYS